MNVTLPEKEKGTNRRIVRYVIIIVICIIAVGIAMYQFFADEKLEVILGIVKSDTEEIEELRTNFDSIFENKLSKNSNISDVNKIDTDKDLVYTSYEKQENILGNYDLNVNIPYINIDDSTTKKYNEEIKNSFEKLAEQIQQTQDRNIIYNVKYMANIENDILSIVISSNFKEGSNPQRTIVQTYNYNLSTHKEETLSELIKIKNIDKSTFESQVKSEIVSAANQAEKLKSAGYTTFTRNTNDSMYKLENTTEFFIHNNHLYVIYPYGNQNNTTEKDVVIFI